LEIILIQKKKSLLAGDYSAILSLKRLIGAQAKTLLDYAIDLCATVLNLREAIYQAHLRSETKPHYYELALHFLERYFYLLLFTQYVLDESHKNVNERFQQNFEYWLSVRPEISNLLANLSLS